MKTVIACGAVIYSSAALSVQPPPSYAAAIQPPPTYEAARAATRRDPPRYGFDPGDDDPQQVMQGRISPPDGPDRAIDPPHREISNERGSVMNVGGTEGDMKLQVNGLRTQVFPFTFIRCGTFLTVSRLLATDDRIRFGRTVLHITRYFRWWYKLYLHHPGEKDGHRINSLIFLDDSCLVEDHGFSYITLEDAASGTLFRISRKVDVLERRPRSLVLFTPSVYPGHFQVAFVIPRGMESKKSDLYLLLESLHTSEFDYNWVKRGAYRDSVRARGFSCGKLKSSWWGWLNAKICFKERSDLQQYKKGRVWPPEVRYLAVVRVAFVPRGDATWGQMETVSYKGPYVGFTRRYVQRSNTYRRPN